LTLGITNTRGIAEEATSVSGIKVPVEVRLQKKFQDSEKPPLEIREVWFSVECKDPEFYLEGQDIEVLRAAMWELIDKKFAVKWEHYFLVEITRESCYEGIGSGLMFSYKHIRKGTAWDGTLLLRDWHRYSERIEPWPGEFVNKHGKVMACIPDTKENQESLDEFAKRIDALREKLSEFLKPDTIMQTLLGMSGLSLLPPVEEPKEQL
jgi:hypothetical protein